MGVWQQLGIGLQVLMIHLKIHPRLSSAPFRSVKYCELNPSCTFTFLLLLLQIPIERGDTNMTESIGHHFVPGLNLTTTPTVADYLVDSSDTFVRVVNVVSSQLLPYELSGLWLGGANTQ